MLIIYAKIFTIKSRDIGKFDSHVSLLAILGGDVVYEAQGAREREAASGSRGCLYFFPLHPFPARYIMYALDARVAFRSGVVRVRPLVPRVINNLET